MRVAIAYDVRQFEDQRKQYNPGLPNPVLHVSSKAPWFTITDDLSQYEEYAVAATSAGRIGLRRPAGDTHS